MLSLHQVQHLKVEIQLRFAYAMLVLIHFKFVCKNQITKTVYTPLKSFLILLLKQVITSDGTRISIGTQTSDKLSSSGFEIII